MAELVVYKLVRYEEYALILQYQYSIYMPLFPFCSPVLSYSDSDFLSMTSSFHQSKTPAATALAPFELFNAPMQGVNLVESSAGTGKTYNISGLVVRILAEADSGKYAEGLDPSNILVVTFTQAATQELRERISRRVQQSVAVLEETLDPSGDAFLEDVKKTYAGRPECIKNLRNARQNMDQASIYTIHGFCQQALQEHALESNSSFDVQYTGNDRELRVEAADTLWREELMRLNALGEEGEELKKLLLRQIETPDNLVSLFADIAGKPYARFYENWDEADFNAHYLRVMAAVGKMRATFDKAELSSLMNEHQKALHGNRFKKQQWMQMLDSAEQGLTGGFSYKEVAFWKLRAGQKKTKAAYDDVHHPFFEAIEAYIQSQPELLLEGYHVVLARRYLQQFQALKEERRLRSFDDILISMQQAVGAQEQAYGKPLHAEAEDAVASQEFCEKLRLQYPFALVDEFQDTDPVQLAIVKKLYFGQPDTCLYMIGDPKQSIYKFRGADIASYQSVARSPEVRKFTLGKNFRSAKEMIDAVNVVFTQAEEGKTWPGGIRFMPSSAHKTEKELFTEDERPQPFQFMLSPPEETPGGKTDAQAAIDDAVVDEVQRLLELSAAGKARIGPDRPVQPNDIAILVGKHFQASGYRKRLLERGIKSIHKTNQSVYRSAEATFLTDLMRLLGRITNAPLLRMFLFSEQLGYKVSDIQRLDDDAEGYSELLETLTSLRETYERRGFSALLRRFLYEDLARLEDAAVPVIERILSRRDGEQAYTNLMHLNDLIDRQEREQSPSLEELLKWLEGQISDTEKGSEEAEIRIDSDDALVHLVTLHGSKGLEYPIIFCPTLWEQDSGGGKKAHEALVFKNDAEETEVRFTDYEKDDIRARVKEESLAENLRLMYVALTRARYRCYLPAGPAMNRGRTVIDSPVVYCFTEEEKLWEKKAPKKKESLHSDFLSQLRRLAQEQPELFVAFELPAKTGSGALAEEQQQHNFEVRPRTRTYSGRADWFITSYSSIKKGKTREADDGELDAENDKAGEDTSESRAGEENQYGSILNFEKGARAGTFMHRLFEDLDFPRLEQDGPGMIESYLEEDGFEAEWQPVLMDMLRASLNTPLPGSGARLITKGRQETRDELEFYFSFSQADADDLVALMGGKMPSCRGENPGFMIGFIDLLFEHEGRFYILDYKSDHLGNAPRNYAAHNLADVMEQRGYSFQYHIYLVALMRFLKYRLGEAFEYQRHVGGAYYLFLRGLDDARDSAEADAGAETASSQNGIFFHNPEQRVIEAIDAYFSRKEAAEAGL